MATAIDMHNIVSTGTIENIVEKFANSISNAPNSLPAIMLRGAPGVGKSTIVKSVAEKLGIGFVDVRLAEMERVDVAGLPSVEKGVTKWNVPAIWPQDKNSRGIILLDEITSAPADVQVAAYQLVLDREISNSNYKLPNGWLIVAAGNRAQDRAVVKSMSSALANRFVHFEVEANSEDWGNWAVQHNIHPSVTGFINYRPANLFKMDNQNLEQGWPSPRSWERVSNIMALFDSDEETLRKAVYGLVGNAVGVEFMEFHKINKKFTNVLDYLTNPKAKIEIPERSDEKYALASAVSYLLWNGGTAEDDKTRIEGMYRVCMKFSADFATMIVKAAMLGNNRVSRLQAVQYITKSPSYKAFAEKFGKAFNKSYSLAV